MQIQDLRPGDILIFKSHNDSKLSRIISILTKSDVSHSAIVDEDTNYLLEASLDGGARTPIESYSPRVAYIRRLETCPTPSFAVEIAKSYVQTGFPYSYAELVASGLYLLSCRIAPLLEHGKLLCTMLEIATYAISKAIDYKKNNGKEAMICSELVYRSYAEAALSHGSEFEIHLTQESRKYQTILDALLDYVSKTSPEITLQVSAHEVPDYTIENAVHTMEDCYGELFDLKTKAESYPDTTFHNHSCITPKLLQKAGLFCHLVLELKGISMEDKESLKDILTAMLRIKAVFVSPADLCYHTTNLTDYETLNY
ncbi:MAG TPA: hypothetical protein VJY54_03820 [Lachnospiraceae bacterium]|nr:hypothetical protein [Lachnospiraceae bacterium]